MIARRVHALLIAVAVASTAAACSTSGGTFGRVGPRPPGTVTSPIMAGYEDTPAGATPMPTAAPDALAEARPLEIEFVRVPINRAGRFEVEVGRAVLPNGLLTEASLDISDPPFPGFQLGGVTVLEIRPVDPPGPRLWNRYVTGWRKGTVTVAAVVTFEIVTFEPGAMFELRDIVVR